jgi:hypothetical protein
VLPSVDLTVPKSVNSCVGKTITGKSSLIPEQNISQKFWPRLQPFHKKRTWLACSPDDTGRNHYGANLPITVFVLDQSSRNSTSRLLVFWLRSTAARTPSSTCWCCSHCAFPPRKQAVRLRILCALSNVLRCG